MLTFSFRSFSIMSGMKKEKPKTLSEWSNYFDQIDKIELETTCRENKKLYKKYFTSK
jgi:hypothetical protein